jgi:thiaminase
MKLRQIFEARVARVSPLLLDGFVSAVASDTLTERQLAIYLAQEVHYLESLAGILLDLRDAFTDPLIQEVLNRHSYDASKTRSDISRILVQTPDLSAMSHDPIRPTTYAYISHQRSCLRLGPRPCMWSLLPCYLFYPTFVRAITNCSSKRPFMQSWLKSLPKYDGTILWKDEIEEIFLKVNMRSRDESLEKVFSISEHYEVMFLRMACTDEIWLTEWPPDSI